MHESIDELDFIEDEPQDKIRDISKDDVQRHRETAKWIRDLKAEQSCLSSDELNQVLNFAQDLQENRPYDHRRAYKTKVTIFQDCMTVDIFNKPVPYSTKEEMDIRAARKNHETEGEKLYQQFQQLSDFDQMELLIQRYGSCDEQAMLQFFNDCFMPKVELGETIQQDDSGNIVRDSNGNPMFRKVWVNAAALRSEKSIESKALHSYKEAVKVLYYNFKDDHQLLSITHASSEDDTKVRNAFKNWLKNHIKPEKYCVFIDYTVKGKVTFKLFLPPDTVPNLSAAQKSWKHGTVKKMPKSLIEYTSAGCIVDVMPLTKYQTNARLKKDAKGRLFITSIGIDRPIELKGMAAEIFLNNVDPAVIANTRVQSAYNDAFPHTRLTAVPTATPQ